MAFDVDRIRGSFPALQSDAIYFDNPGGTQVAAASLDRMRTYLVKTNANQGGAFSTSRASDAMVEQARRAVADFLHAERSEEIVFGPNMTSLTLALSRSIAQDLGPDDEIIVTHLDHDANIAPWMYATQASGAKLRWVDFNVEDCTLDLDSFHEALSERTRLVAVGAASNAVGTINPVGDIAEAAHEVGALCFVDAVQLAPHRGIDVQALDCDFLAVSGYKFFGPHIGVLYGRYDLLDHLPAYRVRPAPAEPPGKWESGTSNFEGIAGLLGALEYLEELGQREGGSYLEQLTERYSGRILDLKLALAAIEEYELVLARALLEALKTVPGITVYGLTDESDIQRRVPTVAFRMDGIPPRRVARLLSDIGIHAWDGNFYALAVTERLGVEKRGGLVRVGLVHYNTLAEVGRLVDGLRTMQAT